jgi:hypothetical protein
LRGFVVPRRTNRTDRADLRAAGTACADAAVEEAPARRERRSPSVDISGPLIVAVMHTDPNVVLG